MTSRDTDLVAVGTQMVLGIGRQTRTRGWGQRTRRVGGAVWEEGVRVGWGLSARDRGGSGSRIAYIVDL